MDTTPRSAFAVSRGERGRTTARLTGGGRSERHFAMCLLCRMQATWPTETEALGLDRPRGRGVPKSPGAPLRGAEQTGAVDESQAASEAQAEEAGNRDGHFVLGTWAQLVVLDDAPSMSLARSSVAARSSRSGATPLGAQKSRRGGPIHWS
jgi:hypothetical protein